MRIYFAHFFRFSICKVLALLFVALVSVPAVADDGRSYVVEQFYLKEKLIRGSKVLLSMDRLEDRAEAVLVPTEPVVGEYSVEVRKIDFNFYWIVGSDIYVETKYCYELSYPQTKAVLVVDSPYGIEKGKLIFL
ncbi:MAG: hypothetical protein ACI35Q_07065 [Marinilabiliaceae bacterium]